jgi:peptidoglycan/xylan/chitin deacetylase (PgdA/CDA1 family)
VAFAVLSLVTALHAEVITHGPSSCGQIAITFDLCPVLHGTGFNRPLIDQLEARHIPATFFPSGTWMASHDAELRELLSVPYFEIGTHGEVHAHLPTLSAARQRAEILGPVARLSQTYHRPATLFRPPYGEYTPDTVRIAEDAGQKFVLWSVVSGDPDPNLTAAAIERDVEQRVRPGSVIIFHANGRGWHTAEVIDAFYGWLAARHALTPVTMTTLLSGCGHGTGAAAR